MQAGSWQGDGFLVHFTIPHAIHHPFAKRLQVDLAKCGTRSAWIFWRTGSYWGWKKRPSQGENFHSVTLCGEAGILELHCNFSCKKKKLRMIGNHMEVLGKVGFKRHGRHAWWLNESCKHLWVLGRTEFLGHREAVLGTNYLPLIHFMAETIMAPLSWPWLDHLCLLFQFPITQWFNSVSEAKRMQLGFLWSNWNAQCEEL